MSLETSVGASSEVITKLQPTVTTLDETEMVVGVNEALTRTMATFDRNVTFVGETGESETVAGLSDVGGRLAEFFVLNTDNIRSFLVDKVAAKIPADKQAEANNIITFLLAGVPPNMAHIMLGQVDKIPAVATGVDGTVAATPQPEISSDNEEQKKNEVATNTTPEDNKEVVDSFFSDEDNPIKVGGLGKNRKEKFRAAMSGMVANQAAKLGITLTAELMKDLQVKLIELGAVKKNGKWPQRRAKKIEIATYQALIEIAGNPTLKGEKAALETFFAAEKFVMMHQSSKDLLPILVHLVARESDKAVDADFLEKLKAHFVTNRYLKKDKKWQFDGSSADFVAKVQAFCAV